MRFRLLLAASSTAALLACAVALTPADAAPQSQAQRSCEARGYVWDNQKGCADKSCVHDGQAYQPGDTRSVTRPNYGGGGGRVTRHFMCDGWTGGWVQVRTTGPQPPTGVGPGTTKPPASTD